MKKVVLPDAVKDYLTERIGREEFLLNKNIQTVKLVEGVKCLDHIVGQRPFMVILPTEMSGMRGFDVCHLLKRDKQLRDTIFILFAPPEDIPEVRDQCLNAKCDALVAFDGQRKQMVEVVSKYLGIELRQAERVDVEMDVDSPGFSQPTSGVMKNISETGMMVEAAGCEFEGGYPLLVDFKLGGLQLHVQGEVTRVMFRDQTKKYEIGVKFKGLEDMEKELIQEFIDANRPDDPIE